MNRITQLFNPKNPWNWGLPEFVVTGLAVTAVCLMLRASGVI